MALSEPFIVDSIEMLARFGRAATQRFSTQNVWFRGLKWDGYKLIPNVFRKHRHDDGPCTFEAGITSAFMARARSRIARKRWPTGTFNWLTLMRHYELPTRLLDWTETLGVAAFFATEQASARSGVVESLDAAIWAINPLAIQQTRENGAPRIANSEDCSRGGYLQNAVEAALTGAMRPDPPQHQQRMPFPVVPDETNHRMLVQRAAFTVHPTVDPIEGFESLHAHLFKAVIPGRVKSELHSALVSLGFDHAGLFPDVDNLAKGLTQRYSISHAVDVYFLPADHLERPGGLIKVHLGLAAVPVGGREIVGICGTPIRKLPTGEPDLDAPFNTEDPSLYGAEISPDGNFLIIKIRGDSTGLDGFFRCEFRRPRG